MDIKKLMAQMQNQFAQTQKKMESMEVSQSIGGDNGVYIQMSGKFEIKDIKIKFLPKDKDDLEILEDMIKKAINGCNAQIEAEIKKYTTGLNG